MTKTVSLSMPPRKLMPFYQWYKVESEKYWQDIPLDNEIFGYQIQKGTRWLPGLSNEEISAFEREMDITFPECYKIFLRVMNGTDKYAINIYGESGSPYAYRPAFYSFPRDLEYIKESLVWLFRDFEIDHDFIKKNNIPYPLPFEDHIFILTDNYSQNIILSIHNRDLIIRAKSLRGYLLPLIDHGHYRNLRFPSDTKFWSDMFLKSLET
jgi:hypothetical protein